MTLTKVIKKVGDYLSFLLGLIAIWYIGSLLLTILFLSFILVPSVVLEGEVLVTSSMVDSFFRLASFITACVMILTIGKEVAEK